MDGRLTAALWCLWGAAFFAIEIPAWLDHRDGGTLSEYVWTIFGIRGRPRFWRLRRAALALLLALLGYHFLAGGGWLIV